VKTLYRNVAGTVGAVTKMASRLAAIGVLLVATWDDDPVVYDPLISD
jgi:hypothetical protein